MPLRSTEEQLTLPGAGVSLAEKVEASIEIIRLWEPNALELDPNGYWLGNSGGKDSGVVSDLARRAGVKRREYCNDCTIEPPELRRFIRRAYPQVHWNRPAKPMFARIPEKCMPTRRVRWCCEEYKEHGGAGSVRLLGIRAAESARRNRNWKVVATRLRSNGFAVSPILYWSDDDVWKYIRDRRLPYCELYDEGFTRLGCVGCPMAISRRARDFARWPRFKRLWRKACYAVHAAGRAINKYKDRTAEEFWQWWLTGEDQAKDDGCGMGLW